MSEFAAHGLDASGCVQDVPVEDDFAFHFAHFGGDDGTHVHSSFEFGDKPVSGLVIGSSVLNHFLEGVNEFDAALGFDCVLVFPIDDGFVADLVADARS